MPTTFVGYDEYECDATILYIIRDNALADSAQQDDQVTVVLDKTPFYAESGGQIGDTGIISNDNFRMEVSTCRKTAYDKYLHIGKVVSGSVMTGDKVRASIDVEKRLATARNHTATHLIHKALKDPGIMSTRRSLVTPERLRFDLPISRPSSPNNSI